MEEREEETLEDHDYDGGMVSERLQESNGIMRPWKKTSGRKKGRPISNDGRQKVDGKERERDDENWFIKK